MLRSHVNRRTRVPIKRAAGLLLLTRQLPTQFLLLRHADRWDLPKGHVGARREELMETALRETEEETGLGRCTKIRCRCRHSRFEDSATPSRYRTSRRRQRFRKQVVYYFLGHECEAKVSLHLLTEH